MNAVALHKVTVRLAGRAVIDDLSLQVLQGERLAIIGANGAGKSTLLRLLTGLAALESGRVKVFDHDLSTPLSRPAIRRLRAEVGQVFQGLHLVSRLTVLENVLIGALARYRSCLSWLRVYPPHEIERAQTALRAVSLSAHAGMRVDRLSGGERQKVALARLIMQSPRMLLADEPTAALDPAAGRECAGLLSSLALQNQATLITVVHDPVLLSLLANRVIGMRAGRIAFDLPVKAVDANVLSCLYAAPQTVNKASLERPAAPMIVHGARS